MLNCNKKRNIRATLPLKKKILATATENRKCIYFSKPSNLSPLGCVFSCVGKKKKKKKKRKYISSYLNFCPQALWWENVRVMQGDSTKSLHTGHCMTQLLPGRVTAVWEGTSHVDMQTRGAKACKSFSETKKLQRRDFVSCHPRFYDSAITM